MMTPTFMSKGIKKSVELSLILYKELQEKEIVTVGKVGVLMFVLL